MYGYLSICYSGIAKGNVCHTFRSQTSPRTTTGIVYPCSILKHSAIRNKKPQATIGIQLPDNHFRVPAHIPDTTVEPSIEICYQGSVNRKWKRAAGILVNE